MKISIAIIGAVIGLISGGPVGAVVGFLIGMYIEYAGSESARQDNGAGYRESPPTDFARHLLILIAAVMNADGSAMRSELDLVKRMLIRTYGEQRAAHLLLILREMLKEKQEVGFVCRQIRSEMAYSQRLELLHILFRISRADSDINPSELQLLQQIATQMGITTPDFLSLRAMFVTSPDSDYKILDVATDAGEDEVKKAYRKMAMRFHPDRLLGLTDSEKKAAEEKFLSVQKAYENIKRKRGWS
ncbi:MAG: molecular chaperone DjlA [Bacteroidetes bacterium]|nr:molecular chaperone DjlA [Bacteroidota bacterium]